MKVLKVIRCSWSSSNFRLLISGINTWLYPFLTEFVKLQTHNAPRCGQSILIYLFDEVLQRNKICAQAKMKSINLMSNEIKCMTLFSEHCSRNIKKLDLVSKIMMSSNSFSLIWPSQMLSLSLHKSCLYSELIWSAFSRIGLNTVRYFYLSVFSPNAEKSRTENFECVHFLCSVWQ